MNDEQIFYRKMIGLEKVTGKCIGYLKGIVGWGLLPIEYENKIKETIGVENVSQIPEVQEKIRKSIAKNNLDKYGVEWILCDQKTALLRC